MLNTRRGGRPRNFVTVQAVEMTEPWKRWKSQTAAFPPLPPLLGNLADGARFPHSHRPDGLRRKEGKGRHRTRAAPRIPTVPEWSKKALCARM